MDFHLYTGLRALHFIGFVVWFAGLFYLGRLLVYHREACARPDDPARDALRDQLRLMSERLWIAITIPGMLITAVPGFWLMFATGALKNGGWMHAKLTLVVFLVAYHTQLGRMVGKLRGEGLTWSSKQLRLFNEVPTLLLVSIAFLAAMKNQVSWLWLVGSIIGLGVLIGGTVALLARRREGRS